MPYIITAGLMWLFQILRAHRKAVQTTDVSNACMDSIQLVLKCDFKHGDGNNMMGTDLA
jgi:hypothetical protein